MWNTTLINQTYCELSVKLMEVLSAGKTNPYSEYRLILMKMNYCPFQDEMGIKESTSSGWLASVADHGIQGLRSH